MIDLVFVVFFLVMVQGIVAVSCCSGLVAIHVSGFIFFVFHWEEWLLCWLVLMLSLFSFVCV